MPHGQEGVRHLAERSTAIGIAATPMSGKWYQDCSYSVTMTLSALGAPHERRFCQPPVRKI
jgi:hypothetical protein